MATVTATDFLVATGTPGLWVRLHNNVSGTDYYSTAVSDPQGAFTYTVPAGDYSLYVGSAATVPGTPTLRSAHYQVAIRNGDDAALNSATATIGPYTSDFPGGVTNQVTRGSSDFTYDKGGMFVNINGPKYRNIGTWDPVAGSGDASAAINQAIIDGTPIFPPGGFYNVTGAISNPNSVPLVMLGNSVFSGSGAPTTNIIRLGFMGSIFVASTGSDSNLGIGAGSPFLTLQRAVDVAATFAGFGVAATIYIASGSYVGATLSSNGLSFNSSHANSAPASILLSGGFGGGTTTITRAGGGAQACISCYGYGAAITIGANITFTSTNHALYAQAGGAIYISGACTFGACTGEHMHADYQGLIVISSSYTISGGGTSHFGFSLRGSIIFAEVNNTVTLTGSPVFSTAFAYLSDESLLYIPNGNITFSGAAGATTIRFLIRRSATLETNGGSATYLPGTAAGQVLDQGRYYPTPALVSVGSLSAGWGTGASAAVIGNEREGLITVTTGTTPGNSGSLTLTGSFIGPIAGNFGVALFQLSNNGGAFNARATVIITGTSGTPSVTITVDNNAVNFAAGVTLSIAYITRPF